jgi:polyisoprenoid-binding protein YceI
VKEESRMAEATSTTTPHGVEAPDAGVWNIDAAHSSVSFVARHMMVSKVRGHFGQFSGQIHVADNVEGSWAEVTIDPSSITTGVEMRDNHLRSADFFEIEKFPDMKFRSTKVERTGPSSLKVAGALTIRDVTRPVVLDVDYEGLIPDPRFGARVAFSASTQINREDWGITWNQALETGGVVVGKTVRIELDVAAVPAKEQIEAA